MKKTKIVCTMGPASMEVETIKRMITAGMDLVRLNFSHGSHEELRQTIANVRLASKETGKPVGILADHQGPKIRIGTLPEPVLLKEGDTVRLVAGEAGAAAGEGIFVDYPTIAEDVPVGNTIFLADGLIELRVERRRPEVSSAGWSAVGN